jgi:hypothetical protein
VLVAILKKRLALDASLHEILQILSITLFEQVPILQAFGDNHLSDCCRVRRMAFDPT